MKDFRECAVTGATDGALEPYELAVAAFAMHRPEARALAARAAREAEGFVAAHQLQAWLLLCSRNVRDFEGAGWAYARAAALGGNERERAHGAALAAAVDGDYAGATRLLDALLVREPRDLVALMVAQAFDYYLGAAEASSARTARVLRHWSPSLPGYHAVLASHAFGLEECGLYDDAELAARRALELEPRDLRAHHAVTHVMEMQGRAEEGLRWAGSRAASWTGAGGASTHLWWHVALLQLQLDRPGQALLVYDRRLQGEALSELIDASALLWRLQLAGVDVGSRFAELASRWAPHASDAHCAFNDLHAMMAFAGAGRWESARELLAALERRLERRGGANYEMTRLVGLPACRAVSAFARGDHAAAAALLRGLPPVAHRIGGSHAQRDILQLTRAAADAARRHAARIRDPGPGSPLPCQAPTRDRGLMRGLREVPTLAA